MVSLGLMLSSSSTVEAPIFYKRPSRWFAVSKNAKNVVPDIELDNWVKVLQ